MDNVSTIEHLVSTLGNSTTLITEVDNYVFIDLDRLVNRKYQFTSLPEFMYNIGKYQHSILVFLSRDGANLVMSGAQEIITFVVESLNLNSTTCYLYGYVDNITVANTTKIPRSSIQVWASQIYNNIKDLSLAGVGFDKKFAGLFGRHDLYRLKICKHLHSNYINDSIISYNSPVAEWSWDFSEEFKADIAWAKRHCPILLDFDPNDWVSFNDSLNQIAKHYQNYFIEIVAETDPLSNTFFTEKSLKNFYLGKPFILFAGAGSLANLHTAGFKTFSPFIDESYDNILSPHVRLQAVLKEIDRLAKMTLIELQDLHIQLAPIYQHNRTIYKGMLFENN